MKGSPDAISIYTAATYQNWTRINSIQFNSKSLLYQQPPVPGGWGYYDGVNLITKLNYELNYTRQITGMGRPQQDSGVFTKILTNHW